MDFNDHTNEEICKTYHLIPISTTTTVENQLSVYSPYSENNKSFESSLKINLEITKKEELILSTTEQIDESMTLIVTELKHIEHSSQQIYSNIKIDDFYMKNNCLITNNLVKYVTSDNCIGIPTMKKEVVSGSSFYIGNTYFIDNFLLLLSSLFFNT